MILWEGWCSNYTPALSQKVKTTTTQANCCLELFIGVVWRSPRAGKASVPNNRRKGCRCRAGEKGELASTGTVTNYNTIGTCEKNRPRRTAYLAEPSQIWKAKQTKVTYVLTLGLRRYLNMIGEGSRDKMSLSANGIINYKRYVSDFQCPWILTPPVCHTKRQWP